MKRTLNAAVGLSSLALTAAPAIADPTIPVIVKNTTAPIWQMVLAGACQAGKEFNAKVVKLGPTSEADITGQIAQLENAVTNNASAIVISPNSSDALGPPIEEAAAKVPVITIDTPANADKVTAFLGTNNIKAGQIAADALGAAIEKKYGKAAGKIAIVSVMAGVQTLVDRDKGFTDELKAKYPDLQIVTTRIGTGEVTTSLSQTTDVLSTFPDLRGIFGDGIYVGLGAGQAVSEAKAQDHVMLVAIDSSDQMVKFLREGAVQALIVQDFYQMGYGGVQTAVSALKGETVPKVIDTGLHLVTLANVDTPESKKVVAPDLTCN
jgi:ribose transport system substrate-binding protein